MKRSLVVTALSLSLLLGTMGESQAQMRQISIKVKRAIATAVLAATMMVPVGMGVHTHNVLVGEQQSVKTAWSQVDVSLQRRSDLVGNMVQVVKGYAKHENTTLIGVANAAANAQLAFAKAVTPADKIAAANQMSLAMQPLLLLQQTYPDLKANTQFSTLASTLKDTNDRVAIDRSRYNDAANALNTHVRKFPASIIAGMSNIQPEPYFQAESGARSNPVVNFDQ